MTDSKSPTPADKTPSAWRIQQALAVWHSNQKKMLDDDPDLGPDETVLSSTIAPNDGLEIDDVICRLLTAVQYAAAMEAAARGMVADLEARVARYERRKDTLRVTIAAIMEVLGERKKQFPHATVSLGERKPNVIITDQGKLPGQFIRIVTSATPDKRAILTALMDGEVVDGAVLGNAAPVLTIRGK